MKKISSQSGFTMIEMILYIAMASAVLLTGVQLSWNLMLADASARAKQEVYYGARLMMSEVSEVFREAEDVLVGSSTFGTHPGVLALDYPGSGTDVIIDTYTKNVNGPSGPATIRTVRITQPPSASVDLTSERVDVTNFVVRNYTRGTERKNIKFEISMERLNPGGDLNFAADIDLETALSIREN
jgi:type II secretory pathway pseudopilin PulG